MISPLIKSDVLKQHLMLSHHLLAQVIGLTAIQNPSSLEQHQLINLIETQTQGAVFISPCTHPEPYREFHYYYDSDNTLWALALMDHNDVIHDIFIHSELLARWTRNLEEKAHGTN